MRNSIDKRKELISKVNPLKKSITKEKAMAYLAAEGISNKTSSENNNIMIDDTVCEPSHSRKSIKITHHTVAIVNSEEGIVNEIKSKTPTICLAKIPVSVYSNGNMLMSATKANKVALHF